MRRATYAILLLSAFPALSVLLFFISSRASPPQNMPQPGSSAYFGFDLNTYPGDTALSILRKTFSFGGFWLNPPPGAKENTWTGKRPPMLQQKFGFLILYNGPLIRDLKSAAQANGRGTADAFKAAAMAKQEGFPAHSIIFLDIEEGGRL